MSAAKPTPKQLTKWEQRLRTYGLGMDRARSKKLSYGWEYLDTNSRNGDERGNPLNNSDDHSEESYP